MKMWRLLPLAVILLAASLRANEVMPMVSGSSSIRPGAKIVFLGDSITHQGRYLRFIDEFLVNSRPGDQIRTYSAGVGGDRTDLCLDRLARDVDGRQPDVIAIMLGMNDCMNEGVATNYEANVVRLVTRLKASNPQARFIWMTPSPYDSGVSLSPDRLGPHPERAERLRQYAAFLRAWQREHGGLLVDFNAVMEDFNRTAQTEDQTFTLCGADRVHPQDIGGYFMARVFLRDVGLLSWKVPQSIVALKSDFETWQTRNDTPAGRLVVERNREQAEFRTLHMIRWQLETLERRNADDFAALRALESSFNGRSGQFEDRVRRYLKEWPRVHETDRRLDEMWTRAYSVALDDAQYDLVIYGGSPAAITAAIKAKVMGLRPIIVSPKTHLGGLSVSGLGFTDSGNTSAIGGLAREFYHRVYCAYQDPSAWRWQTKESFSADGQGTRAMDDAEQTMWTFEPHVAESVFAAWLSEKGVEVRHGEFLDRENGVEKKDGRIVSITTRAGNTYSGRYFIDATYEGDLMAAAGVAYRVGREGNDEYGETWNGNQIGVLHHGHHFRDWKVSPYKVPGDSTSGLCAEVESSAPGVRGEADARVQAYCYRLCLTDDPRNRIPFEKPEGYDPARYALLARVYEHDYAETFSKFDRIANHKTDTNNHGPMNMDYIGHSSVWPEASDARRVELEKEHRDYQKGLLYFIANDLSVPERVRQEMSKWGLAKDEFVDNGGWPYELYVREGRRMVGEYVMTEHDCLDEKIHPNQGHSYGPVGMGSYALDSHNVRRYVTDEGYVQNEGDIGVKAKKPYGIDYGAIVPKRTDCTNLLVPVALSATHTAFGSIRMEPVFMILGESAATAVALAAKGGRAVQDVPYVELSARLEADGQRLQLRKELSSVARVEALGGRPTFENPVIPVDWPDPAIYRGEHGMYYSVATMLRTVRMSSNLIEWTDTGVMPLSANALTKLNKISKNWWAPCVKLLSGKYVLYISHFNTDVDCSISVLVANNPTGPFEFVRTLLDGKKLGIENMIDPFVVADAGRVWLFAGSNQDGLHRLELTEDGLLLKPGTKPVHVAGIRKKVPGKSQWGEAGCWEGTYLHPHGGKWYLFASGGRFDIGTYHLLVGRADTIDGVFYDREGNPLTAGLAKPILFSEDGDRFSGPGHNGEVFTSVDGREWMFFHAHDAALPNKGDRPTLLQELKWTDDGWPYFEGGKVQLKQERFLIK